ISSAAAWKARTASSTSSGLRSRTMLRFAGPDGLLLSVLGVPVAGYDAACQWENEERERESLRLLYVVDTRAKDLLVLPRFSMEGNKPCWSKLCKARLAELPSFDLSA